jgi:hypothetical protein
MARLTRTPNAGLRPQPKPPSLPTVSEGGPPKAADATTTATEVSSTAAATAADAMQQRVAPGRHVGIQNAAAELSDARTRPAAPPAGTLLGLLSRNRQGAPPASAVTTAVSAANTPALAAT